MENTKTDLANLTPDEIAAEEKALDQAKAAKDQANKEAAKKAANVNKTETKTPQALAEKYRKSYPACKTFYITSDEQVFLSDAYNMALLHQNSLKTGELTTIKF